MKNKIQINNQDIRLRPSAVDGFFGCAFQWGKVFLEGGTSIPSSRAAIGTAIHAAAEQCWKESIVTKSKVTNLSTMLDAGMAAWKEETQKGLSYGKNETEASCVGEIMAGTDAFIDDIVPYSAIPTAVEQFYKIDLEHALVKELGGTIDYITPTTIGDIKTSKRKPAVGNYLTQQSIYTVLAKANGVQVENNIIQGIVLKAKPEGLILPMEADEEQAKDLVNIILDTLDLVMEDVAPIETILRPNPKYTFCAQAYCAFYGSCPATKTRKLFNDYSEAPEL